MTSKVILGRKYNKSKTITVLLEIFISKIYILQLSLILIVHYELHETYRIKLRQTKF